MPRVGRPIFKRGLNYVAVRRIQQSSSTVIEPGQSVDHLRTHQLRSLYMRRRIGIKNHPWTIEALKHPRGMPRTFSGGDHALVPTKDGRPWSIADQRFKTKSECLAWAVQSGSDAKPVKDNMVWVVGGERFRTKKQAEAFVAEQSEG